MKLRYSIPGKIWFINNFLSYQMFKGIHNAIIKERKKLNLHSSEGLWNKTLTEGIKAPLRVEVHNYEPFEKLKTLIKSNPFCDLRNITQINTIIHMMNRDSGVNWHDDHGWRYGATFYVNNRWNEKWGGEFMFTDKVGHGWIPPSGNSLVIVKSPFKHKVNPVLTSTIPRISIQIFMK